MDQLLERLHVDVRPSPEVPDEEVLPAELDGPVADPEPRGLPEEPQEPDGVEVAFGFPAALLSSDLPDIPLLPQEHSQGPDITRTLERRTPLPPLPVSAGGAEQVHRPADILDQVPLSDQAYSDSSVPSKPPRQLAAEPDIVASTKKPPPSRPPPPTPPPPPRPGRP